MFNIELLKEILAKYDVHVREYDNFFLAMTHSSYANEHGIKHNERIEYLGDATLEIVCSE